MKRTLFTCILAVLLLALLPSLMQPAEAASLKTQSTVNLTFTTPNIGMSVNEFSATVHDATLESLTIYNAFTEEEVTAGKFETNVVYLINLVIAPNEGYKFNNSSTLVNYNRNFVYITPDDEGKLFFQYIYTNRKKSTSATYLKLPLLQEGMNTRDLEFTYPKDTDCKIESFKVIDLQDGSEATTLQKNKNYRLQMTFLPIEGYLLSEHFTVYLNDAAIRSTRLKAGTYGEGYIDFSLDFGEIALTKLPKAPGGSSWSNTTTVRSAHPFVQVDAYPRWLDSEKHACQGKPVGGEVYYLSVKLLIKGPVALPEAPLVTADGREVSVTVINETTAMVYIRYVADYDMGRVEVTTHGIEEGKPLSGVYADVTGNAHIAKIEFIENSTILGDIEGKVFEGGKQYTVRFTIAPNSGYCGGPNSILVFQGSEYDLSRGTITVHHGLDTRYIVNSANVDISGVAVGKPISGVTLTSDNQALYGAYVKGWASTNTTSTKFAKGHIYQLHFRLSLTNYDYKFTTKGTFTVGGKEAFNLSLDTTGRTIEGIVEFSFLNEVTKVTLPAMPKSIRQGQTLPINFKVSSSAKYTLEPVWIALSTQEEVTTASQKGSYVLVYMVIPKKGYEFTEDTIFYVDGKKVIPAVAYSNGVEIMKAYNVGLTEIDRIDLTVPEPEPGAVPGTVSVSADAPYTPVLQAWGVNTTGKLTDTPHTATVFENYKYHFLAMEFSAAEGYAFADKVTVYINGHKFAVLEEFSLGPAYQMTVTFGKLGDIPKLTAPELSQSGSTLRWDSVRNADAYQVYRATSKSGKYTLVDTVTATTWKDSVTPGKTYYYKVKAVFTPDSAKTSDFSNCVSIDYKLSAPTVSVENNASGKPYITWEKVSGAKKYTIYVATSQNGTYKKLGTSTKTYYTDTKAKAGATYFYKVVANASSSKYSSGYSNTVSCGVICGTPAVTVTVDTTTGKPSLSWKKVDGATQYAIYRKLPTDTEFVLLAKQTAVSYKDTTAPIDTKCEYYVQAMGKTEALNGAVSKVVTATSGIAKPTVTGSLNDLGQPKLSWKQVEGAVKYEVYRSTKSGSGYVLIQTVEGLTCEDTTATIGKTYYYKVKAVGAVSKSADSSYVKLAGKCATPELFIETDDSARPYLKWYKVDGAKKYTVYRATSQNGKYKKIGTTTKIEYIDTKATPGYVYYYKIVANASSSKYSSGYSNIVSCPVYCATPTVTVTNNSAGAPVISWNKVTGAVKYKVMYMDATDYLGSASGPYADFGECHTAVYTTKTSFTIPNTEVGRFYMVVVVAVAKNESYSSEGSEEVFADAVPATPKVTGKVGANKKPVLSWKQVDGAVTYKIYRSTSKSKGYELLDETEDLSYEDLTALKGKTYYYKVVAVRYALSSADSNIVKVKSK